MDGQLIFNKNIRDLKFEDVETFIAAEELESVVLEYKTTIESTDADKRELARSVCAFANSQGGHLVIGVAEEKGKPIPPLVGVPRLLGDTKIEEWTEQVLNSNISQRVAVETAVLPLPANQDRCVLVIEVPHSKRAPHMVTFKGENRYFKRHERQVLRAEEYEVRELFERSRRLRDEVQEYLNRRGYANPDSEHFGRNNLTDKLEGRRRVPAHSIVSFACCPTIIEERIDTTSSVFREWFQPHERPYQPNPTGDFFLPTASQRDTFDGVIRLDHRYVPESPPVVSRFLLVARSGYVEHAYRDGEDHQGNTFLRFVDMIGLFWMFLSFARELYQFANIVGTSFIMLNLANVQGTALWQFGQGWRDVGTSSFPGRVITENEKCWDRHIQYLREVDVAALGDDEIESLVREGATRIGNAFGQDRPRCFNFHDDSF